MKNVKFRYPLVIFYIFFLIFTVFLSFGNAQEGKNISIDLDANTQGIFVIKRVYFSDFEITKFSDFPTQYSLQIISTENKILFEKYLPNELFYSQQANIKITIPIFYTGSTINFFYNKQKIASGDLIANFCKSGDRICYKYCALKALDSDCFFCGNGICETGETKTKCAQDCSGLKTKQFSSLTLPEDIYIESDESFSDLDLEQNLEKRGPGIVFYVSFAIGILALYFLFRKK